MSVEDLEAALTSVRLAEAPDDWALAAYRLAVARSEAAGRPEDIDQALELLDKAARVLTAERAPLEHGRILTAAANCHRSAGRAERALEWFERAAELLSSRAPVNEQAGALINVGLARCEAGKPAAAVDVLDRAVDLIRISQPALVSTNDDDLTGDDGRSEQQAVADDEGGSVQDIDDEVSRLLGAALINRAQARQALGSDDDLHSAITDYQAAAAALPAASLQAGMAAHGLGATILELCGRGAALWEPNDAVEAFEQSLSVLGHHSFPFHHAVARHSLALAYEARGRPGDLARSLNSVHAGVAVFDPRLHATHWRTAHATLARIEAKLDVDEHEAEADTRGPRTGRLIHVARLLAHTTETERETLLRDRLLRASTLPPTAMRADLEALIGSVAALGANEHREVLRTMIGVLMELPDELLEAACGVLCLVHRGHDLAERLDETLDAVINDRLFGPQRIRVRDLLEANGWVRP